MNRQLVALLCGIFILGVVPGPSIAPASAQDLAMGTGRSHPELRWVQRESEHFLLVYPPHLEGAAIEAATVGERVWDTLAAQIEVETDARWTIVLTDEDQIVNGFALPGAMFLWVDVNDFSLWVGGYEKWLRTVVAHELQHNMLMEAGRDWTGIFSLTGIPSWFIEGLAEYETEEWGSGRSDLKVRSAFLRNRHERLDPHDSGFTMVRYLAETYGDSVITAALHKRNWLGLTDFAAGFEEAAGISLSEFKEEWRRAAAAYSYSIYGQREKISDVGEHVELPAQRAMHLDLSSDAAYWAVAERARGEQRLYSIQNDSTKKKIELDHGVFHRHLSAGPGGKIAYSKLHRGPHGGLVYDLKVADTESGQTQWISEGRRAIHPDWSADGEWICFVSPERGGSRLYRVRPDGSDEELLLDPTEDTQMGHPAFSPDGQEIALSYFPPGGGMNIVVLNIASGELENISEARSHDTRPLWVAHGDSLVFTSDRDPDEVHNLYIVSREGGAVEQMTDVNEAIIGMSVDPADGQVLALAHDTVDSLRLRRVPLNRRAERAPLILDERLHSWRNRIPPIAVGEVPLDPPVELGEEKSYHAWKHLQPFAHFVLPSYPWGVSLVSVWNDRARHVQFIGGLDVGEYDDEFGVRAGYARWDAARLPFGLPGMFSAGATWQGRSGLRLYDEKILWERKDGLRIKWRQPFNFGEHLYANHELALIADFTRVDLEEADRFTASRLNGSGLPVPGNDFHESRLELQYFYTKNRRQSAFAGHDFHAQGFEASFEWADEALGSDTQFRRARIDGAKAFGLPLIGSGFLARVRAERRWGQTAPQDFTGLRSDVPLTPVEFGDAGAPLEDLFDIGRNYQLRGYAENVIGDAVITTHLEYRLPLLPELPVNIFGIGIGGLVGVGFYDHGRVRDDGAEILARHTVGWELRAPLTLFGDIAFMPSWGEGQTLKWERGPEPFRKEHYFRLAFRRPW